jgi:hypothetical protein
VLNGVRVVCVWNMGFSATLDRVDGIEKVR